jgi:DNA-binding transcriptional LysR family regulator
VIIASADNDRIREEVTMADVAESAWVFTYQSQTAFTSASRQIQQLGIEPTVGTVVESFVALPLYVAGTQRLGLLQAGLAEHAMAMADVRVYEPPFDATPISNALWWHPMHRRDPEHEWMRTLFEEAAADLGDGAGRINAPPRPGAVTPPR